LHAVGIYRSNDQERAMEELILDGDGRDMMMDQPVQTTEMPKPLSGIFPIVL
jgi:hypothetical protein